MAWRGRALLASVFDIGIDDSTVLRQHLSEMYYLRYSDDKAELIPFLSANVVFFVGVQSAPDNAPSLCSLMAYGLCGRCIASTAVTEITLTTFRLVTNLQRRSAFQAAMTKSGGMGQQVVAELVTMARDRLGTLVKRLVQRKATADEERELFEQTDRLPDDDAEEFKRIKRDFPHLLTKEMSPVNFLAMGSVENTSPAQRMAAYWKLRKALFGPTSEKPLTASGSGALNKGDVEVLDSGFFAVLPNDSNSRSVICYDRSRLEEDFDRTDNLLQSMLRCAFYVLSVIADDEEARTKGITLLEVNHNTFEQLPIDEPFRRELRQLIVEGLPVILNHTYILFKYSRLEEDRLKSARIDEACEVIAKVLPSSTYTVLRGNVKKRLCESLVQSGFQRDGLPVAVGGDWKYFDQFSRWKRERCVVEQLIEAAHLADREGLKVAEEVIDMAMAKNKKRAQDVVYARRKRRKGKIEAKTLEQQIVQLRKEKQNLLETHGRLEKYLAMATTMTSSGQLFEQNSTGVGTPAAGLASVMNHHLMSAPGASIAHQSLFQPGWSGLSSLQASENLAQRLHLARAGQVPATMVPMGTLAGGFYGAHQLPGTSPLVLQQASQQNLVNMSLMNDFRFMQQPNPLAGMMNAQQTPMLQSQFPGLAVVAHAHGSMRYSASLADAFPLGLTNTAIPTASLHANPQSIEGLTRQSADQQLTDLLRARQEAYSVLQDSESKSGMVSRSSRSGSAADGGSQ